MNFSQNLLTAVRFCAADPAVAWNCHVDQTSRELTEVCLSLKIKNLVF